LQQTQQSEDARKNIGTNWNVKPFAMRVVFELNN